MEDFAAIFYCLPWRLKTRETMQNRWCCYAKEKLSWSRKN